MLLRRLGYRALMAAGFLVLATGLTLIALPPPAATGPWVWMGLSALVCGIGIGIAGPPSNNAAVQLMPDQVAAISGLRAMFRQTGGIVRDRTLVKMNEEDFDSVIGVHLKGSFNCGHHAAVVMKDAGYGRIINITSSAGLRGNFGQTNYGAAKAGLMGMTFIWALELGKYGITVNAVAPAGATRMTAGLFERTGEEPPPEQNPALNAPLVAFVASERASHVNGQILGRTDYAYTIFQHPKQIAWMWRDGGWEPEQVADQFDQVLGQHLQHVGMVMPHGMEYGEQK
jgi:NAD(P)-dependent dehydrogenase (short-subunit alcohol dehydrogenase family)